MAHKVIKKFRDKTDGMKLYKKGDSYKHEDADRIAFLIEEGYVSGEESTPESKGIKHTGGGWYELPNGERVQGKENALAALEDE